MQKIKYDFVKMQEKVLFFFLIFSYSSLNTLAFLKFKTSLSHQTGNFFRGILVFLNLEADPSHYDLPLLILVFFFLGTMCSPFVHQEEKKYRLTVFYTLQVTLAWIFGFMLQTKLFFIFFLSFCMGIQNALGYREEKVLVRKTHITGLLTDLGFYLGQILCGKREACAPFFLCLQAFCVFILGVLFAAFLQESRVSPEQFFLVISLLHLGMNLYRSLFIWKK